MNDKDLNQLRTQIKDIDQHIIKLLAQRMDAVRGIGEIKKQTGLPIKDYKVEKEILDRSSDEARRMGLNTELVEQVLTTVIRFSIKEQGLIKNKEEKKPDTNKESCLIIGGHGHMGRWLADFMEEMGCDITIYDQTTNPRSEKTYANAYELTNELIETQDFIFVATPMTATNQILLDIAKAKPKGIVIEICSLKKPILQGLKSLENAGIKIVSMHPMFGPDADYLAGRNIIFCSVGSSNHEPYRRLKDIFAQTSANLIDIPLSEHDDLMSISLNASHLINLGFANLILKSSIDIEKLYQIAGTTFTQQLALTEDVVRENPDLYYEIQKLNPNTIKMYNNLLESLNHFMELIKSSKQQEFKDLMKKCERFLNFLPLKPIVRVNRE